MPINLPSHARLRLAGVDFLPNRQRHRDLAPHFEVMRRMAAGEQTTAELPGTQPTAVPVFSDADGMEYSVVPADGGPSLIPWISGSPAAAGINPETLAGGGFVSADQLQSLSCQARPPVSHRDSPSPRQLMVAAIKTIVEEGMLPLRAREQIAGNNSASRAATAAADAQSAAPSAPQEGPDHSNQQQESSRPSFFDNAPDVIARAVGQQMIGLLGTALATGTITPSNLMNVLGGSITGAMSGFASAFAGAMLAGNLTPESSTAQWAAVMVGPMLAQRMLSGGLISKQFLGLVQGPYEAPALRMGDVDDKGNPILAGCSSVLIEGMPAARVGDPVKAPGGAVVFGARHTEIGAPLFAARADLPPGYGSSDAVGRFLTGAKKTTIGGTTSRGLNKGDPPPPVPDEMAQANPSLPQIVHDPDNPIPSKQAGFVWEPQTGEWRMWSPEHGFSSSLGEYAALPDVLPDSVLQALGWDSSWSLNDAGKSWSILGFDLGNPHWPNAGTGSTWYIPDRLFFGLVDMKDYYTLHDWLFHPDAPHEAQTWTDFFHIFSRWEIPAFEAGLANRPWQLPIQIIYSLATTLASIMTWLDNYGRTSDEAAGYPDIYGHYPHDRGTDFDRLSKP